jgi:DNA-binding transcriptional LysR family regulator
LTRCVVRLDNLGVGAPYPQLDVFLTVARLRSFSAAARELRVTRSAVSQAVRQLEAQLAVVLLARTTRSVSLTDAGRRLVDGAGPAMIRARDALAEAAAPPGEPTGRLRFTVPLAMAPIVAAFRARNPKVDVELDVERRFVDIVADGYDAGVRLRDAIPRDMVHVRLTGDLRWLVVGAPAYLARHGTPREPNDLLRHECINLRFQSTGALYAWELEHGRRTWRVPVRGGLVSNDAALRTSFAVKGLGLAYAFEPSVREELRDGRLRCVLESYAPTVPGFYLYYPRQARHSLLLRRFVAVAKEAR